MGVQLPTHSRAPTPWVREESLAGEGRAFLTGSRVAEKNEEDGGSTRMRWDLLRAASTDERGSQ